MSDDLGNDYHEGRPSMIRGLVLLAAFIAGVAIMVLVGLLLAQVAMGLR